MKFFKRQIQEIAEDKALSLYGACIALTHVVTFLSWYPSAIHRLAQSVSFCWPFFQSCYALRPMNPLGLKIALFSYFGVGLLAVALFLRRRTVGKAYGLLLALTVFKFAFFAQDYRMMGNYHYMIFITSAIFLFASSKRPALLLVTVGYYLAAGILKFNYEWLSAASLAPRTILSRYVPMKLLQISCAFVVVLEMFISWLLLARNRILFWSAVFLFFAFHLFSWHIVSFLYPCVMFCLLPIFVLCRFIPDPLVGAPKNSEMADSVLLRFFQLRLPKAVYGVLGIFVLCQFWPHFFRGDSALTTEGRMLSMNMFDARIECDGQVVLSRPGFVEVKSPQFFSFGILLHCDPLIFFDYANSLCRELEASHQLETSLDLYLNSKRSTEENYRPVISVKDFCHQKLSYSMFFGNDWILK